MRMSHSRCQSSASGDGRARSLDCPGRAVVLGAVVVRVVMITRAQREVDDLLEDLEVKLISFQWSH